MDSMEASDSGGGVERGIEMRVERWEVGVSPGSIGLCT